jgi:hypothetical protein
MPAIYSIYGMVLCSDQPIPGLVPVPATRPADVELHLGSAPPELEEMLRAAPEPWYVSPYRDERGEPVSRGWRLAGGAYLRLRYCDGTEFFFDRMGARIWSIWSDRSTLDDTATYLLGPVLSFLLGLRGTPCLHASVIAVDGKAVALLGPPGAGKSTTAAAFAQRGYPVLSDDVAAVHEQDGRFLIQPAYPRIRLWPSSVKALYGSPEALPRITPTWDKRDLDLTANGCLFQSSPLPLAAIYFLAPRVAVPVAPLVEGINGQDSLMCLISNVHTAYMLGRPFPAQSFNLLNRLLRCIAVRRVVADEDRGRIPQLCDAILDDFRRLPIALR